MKPLLLISLLTLTSATALSGHNNGFQMSSTVYAAPTPVYHFILYIDNTNIKKYWVTKLDDYQYARRTCYTGDQCLQYDSQIEITEKEYTILKALQDEKEKRVADEQAKIALQNHDLLIKDATYYFTH